MTGRLTKAMIEDAKHLLGLLGIPYVQALGEAEAQAAYMTARGDVWATGSKDYDSLLFGSPRLVRYITLTGKEFLPSRGTFRPLKPEVIELKAQLARLGRMRARSLTLSYPFKSVYVLGLSLAAEVLKKKLKGP